MAKEDVLDLLRFLDPFPTDKQKIALQLREWVWGIYPTANELIYDNYNALAFGWSVTDKQSHIICSVALYRGGNKMHFGFYWGNEIDDPENKLVGEGKQYRYYPVTDLETFPWAYIEGRVKESYANSLAKVKDPKQMVHGKTIVKMVLDKKRPTKSR
jgi:hypothetical protein